MSIKSPNQYSNSLALSILAALLVAGCKSNQSSAPVAKTPVPTAPPAATTKAPAAVGKVAIRINAGASAGWTNSQGIVWLSDQGFTGGDVIERPGIAIAKTTDAEVEIYRSEHYSMDSFSWPVANGKYTVKLHFCETYDGITGPGERVFSYKLQGHEVKDFDVWKKAGAAMTAYVDTVPVDVTDGKLTINFTSNVENPQINGIEIIPQP